MLQNKGTVLGAHEQESDLCQVLASKYYGKEVFYPLNHPSNENIDLGPLTSPKRNFCSLHFELASSQKVAAGQTGDLFLSTHRVLGRCSLKRFKSNTPVSIALHEASVIRELKGGPILPMLGGFYDGALTIVFADCTASMVDYLDQFEQPHVVLAAEQIAKALQFIHSKDIIHCEIRPENIVIKDDRFLLTQFAGALRAAGRLTVKRKDGFKAAYYQDFDAIHNALYSVKTDLWGLMLTLFYMDKRQHLLQSLSGELISIEFVKTLYTTGFRQENGKLVSLKKRLKTSRFFDMLTSLGSSVSAEKFLESEELKTLMSQYTKELDFRLSPQTLRVPSKIDITTDMGRSVNTDVICHLLNGKFYFEEEPDSYELVETSLPNIASITQTSRPNQAASPIVSTSAQMSCPDQLPPLGPSSQSSQHDQPPANDDSNQYKVAKAPRTSRTKGLPANQKVPYKTIRPRGPNDAKPGHHFVCFKCHDFATPYLHFIEAHSDGCKQIIRK